MGPLTTEDPATTPNPSHSSGEAVAPVGGHGRLDHFQRLCMSVSEVGALNERRKSYLTQGGDPGAQVSMIRSGSVMGVDGGGLTRTSSILRPLYTERLERCTSRYPRGRTRTQQVAELDRLLFELPAGGGHISGSGRHLRTLGSAERGPDQGIRGLRRLRDHEKERRERWEYDTTRIGCVERCCEGGGR